jgi:multidrug efflux system outer membrane protein
LAAGAFDARLPVIRAGVPMEMLAARPDVAAAKAELVAAYAHVGVARAEYFPKVTLIGSGGYSNIKSSDFLEWSSRTFVIGPEVSVPIFQGGRLRANEKLARAEFAEAVADYRQTVLNALRDVENALADLAAARDQTGAQARAVEAAGRALELSNKRYRAGLVSSLEVVDAVREQLEAERRAVQIRGRQFEATVQLIQGLGGGVSVR